MTTTTMNKNKTCHLCGYKWISRKDKPKECPRCKRRFDYPKNEGFINEEIVIRKSKKGGRK